MITTEDFTRVNSDSNGNPRYVLHFLKLADKYNDALILAKNQGGRKFHNKQYGGGIVFMSYNLNSLTKDLNNLIGAK